MNKWLKYICIIALTTFIMIEKVEAKECEYILRSDGAQYELNASSSIKIEKDYCQEIITVKDGKEVNLNSDCYSVDNGEQLNAWKDPVKDKCYSYRLKEAEKSSYEEIKQKEKEKIAAKREENAKIIGGLEYKLEDINNDSLYCYQLEKEVEGHDKYITIKKGEVTRYNAYLCVTSTPGISEENKIRTFSTGDASNQDQVCYKLTKGVKCSKLKEGSGTSKPEYTSGCDALGETLTLIKEIYNFIKYAVPVLIIVLSIADFIKAIINSDEKNYKETWNKLIKRIIIGMIILILPQILSLIISLSGVTKEYGINNIFCIFK